MTGFQLPDQPERGSGSGVTDLGNIALKVEEFDRRANAVVGVDMSTGEERRIEMVDEQTFADVYVDRNTFTTERDRLDRAAQQLAKQPTVSRMAGFAQGEGTVIQFQSVKQIDDRMVARWATALTTDPEREAYRRAMIEVNVPKSNAETRGDWERRRLSVYFMDDTQPASREGLEAMTRNRVADDAGRALDGRVRSQVLFTVSDGDRTYTGSAFTPYDRQARREELGAEAFVKQPLTAYNALPMAALAGKVGIDVDDLRLMTRPDDQVVTRGNAARVAEGDVEELREQMRAVHDASARGLASVTITPGSFTEAMRFLKDKIVEGEQGRGKQLTGRGFFEADISYQVQPERRQDDGGVFPATALVKEARPTGYLHALDDDKFEMIRRQDLGDMAQEMAVARGLDVMAGPRSTPDAEARAEAGPEAGPMNENPGADGPEPEDAYAHAGLGMT